MQTQISATSIPASAAPNEDYYLASDTWAIVLDGITRYPDDGCVHDVPWYVKRLGSALVAHIEDHDKDLRIALKRAIAAVSNEHRVSCDLENPVSPGSTVTITRIRNDEVEWLVLGDSSIAFRTVEGQVEAKSDERLARLTHTPPVEDVAGIRRFPVDYIAQVRNRPNGFWVASTDPDAADTALTGSFSTTALQSYILCTDGLTRLVERYSYRWETLFAIAAHDGVSALTDLVRKHEFQDPATRSSSKPHDDVTGVLVQIV